MTKRVPFVLRVGDRRCLAGGLARRHSAAKHGGQARPLNKWPIEPHGSLIIMAIVSRQLRFPAFAVLPGSDAHVSLFDADVLCRGPIEFSR